MIHVKIFFGGTPQEAEDAFKSWRSQQQEIELTTNPVLEPGGKGWQLTVWYREMNPQR